MPPSRNKPGPKATGLSATPGDAVRPKDEICELNSSYQSDEADFTLVSSDGYIFKVDTYRLMASSSVFRNMIRLNTLAAPPSDLLNQLELTDTTTEKAVEVRTFLDWIYEKVQLDTAKWKSYFQLLKLFKKYDCESALRTFTLSVENALWNGSDPHSIFVLGAWLDNVGLCSKAIQKGGRWQWVEANEGDILEKNVKGGSVFDLTSMTETQRNLIPSRYQTALLRASRKSKTMEPGKADWGAIAAEFGRLLQPAE